MLDIACCLLCVCVFFCVNHKFAKLTLRFQRWKFKTSVFSCNRFTKRIGMCGNVNELCVCGIIVFCRRLRTQFTTKSHHIHMHRLFALSQWINHSQNSFNKSIAWIHLMALRLPHQILNHTLNVHANCFKLNHKYFVALTY